MALIYGNALKFASASSQYSSRVRVSNAVNNITLAFWIKVDTLPGTSSVIFLNGGAAQHEGYRINLSSAGILQFDMIFVNAGCATTTGLIAGTWYHIIAERDAGTSTIYINAAANGTTSSSQWNAIGATAVSSLAASMDDSSANPTSYSDITLDDVRYYDRALNSTERTNLYNLASNPANAEIDATSLMGWWKLDETSGTAPADSSGNSKTLTNVNTPTWVTGIFATGSSASGATTSLMGV